MKLGIIVKYINLKKKIKNGFHNILHICMLYLNSSIIYVLPYIRGSNLIYYIIPIK